MRSRASARGSLRPRLQGPGQHVQLEPARSNGSRSPAQLGQVRPSVLVSKSRELGHSRGPQSAITSKFIFMSHLSLKQYGKATFAAGAILLLPALWSFVSAAWSAATTGEVLVIGLGRYETSRALVPWMNGWARFAGPLALIAAVALWTLRTASWRAPALLSAAGLALLLFSKWFTSPTSAMTFCGMMAYLALAAAVDRRMGRFATTVMLASTVGLMLWLYARPLGS